MGSLSGKMARLTMRKGAIMLSTAGVFAGVLMFNRLLVSGSPCFCDAGGPAYSILQRNEVTIKANHPLISSIDLVHLPSNTPTEDRLALGGLTGSGTGLFAVIDGHAYPHCSEYLKHTLLPAVVEQLKKSGVMQSNDELITVNPYDTTSVQHLNYNDPLNTDTINTGKIEDALRTAFVALDKNISDDALKCVRKIAKGHSLKEDSSCIMKVARAVSGACALVAMVTRDIIFIGSTGDCRVVVGWRKGRSVWSATPLSVDQNVKNKEEVKRLMDSHPGEEKTVIMNGRLLGSLMPLRSFGDVSYKWSKEDQSIIDYYVPPNYKTPPYLTAEPVVTSKPIDGNDGFLILATDGLWDKLDNHVAVEIVGRMKDGGRSGSLVSRLFGGEDDSSCCSSDNAATRLLWHALGGDEVAVTNMLQLPKEVSRVFRDDISIMVVHFKHQSS